MSDSKYDPEHEHIMRNALHNHPVAKASMMFGYPAYKVNGKLAVSLFDTGIVVKVGPERARKLVGQAGIQGFEPMSGRMWKEWVLITGNFETHQILFDEAVQYVLEENSR